ncbi:hypothetical protein K1728_12055 (plasmid) [Weissella confusa]|uniref:hypothetical protein n=1 Tax=Weissella confusa TaxID=1583 RepID=UPI001C6FC243|nr:hypothetical protein [Weissella confusa]QYU58997.1 hypothetical protein K1728_12055 [Weissella confusa]
MDEKETFFNSVTELSKHLGISRKTLYERAKRDGIDLNGSYTQNELDSLRIKGNKSVSGTKVNDNSQKETEQNDTALLDALRTQISMLEADKERLYSELDTRNKHIDELNKQVDQSQQLQLKTQLQLEAEQQKVLALETELKQDDIIEETDQPEVEEKKSFWGRIFG